MPACAAVAETRRSRAGEMSGPSGRSGSGGAATASTGPAKPRLLRRSPAQLREDHLFRSLHAAAPTARSRLGQLRQPRGRSSGAPRIHLRAGTPVTAARRRACRLGLAAEPLGRSVQARPLSPGPSRGACGGDRRVATSASLLRQRDASSGSPAQPRGDAPDCADGCHRVPDRFWRFLATSSATAAPNSLGRGQRAFRASHLALAPPASFCSPRGVFPVSPALRPAPRRSPSR